MFKYLMESDKNFEDLYEVLEVHMGSSTKEIIKQYKLKIEHFNNKIKIGEQLNKEEQWCVKLLKIAKYVLTTKELRDKYNISRVLEDSEVGISTDKNEIEIENTKSVNKYYDYKNTEIPIRKDQNNNYEELANRQFERFDHNNFDLTKDRMLRSSNEN
jgi:hypothetical protein